MHLRRTIQGRTKITPQQLENFATQIARPDFDIDAHDGIEEMIGHLSLEDYDAVLARAAEIVRKRAEKLRRS
ncbi:hypothetical protein [Bradyrhizobium sp.]|uniref:hypothetical protein n=1 Tax=Bradyrhizobium sp. TaxID=376 RepID=UPI00403762D7